MDRSLPEDQGEFKTSEEISRPALAGFDHAGWFGGGGWPVLTARNRAGNLFCAQDGHFGVPWH
jgi:hypothetical protein